MKIQETIYILDYPGFGNSTFNKTLDIFDYTEIIKEFIIKLHLDNTILIGHSFGGRIAINYASLYKVDKLVLFGSPFIVRKNNGLKVKILN